MDEYKYIIYDIPPTNNKYLGNSHSFNIYRNDKNVWEWLVRQAVGNNRPKIPFKKGKVTIKYYFKDKRRHDPDNYSGKFINDGLVKAGIIEDDSFNCIELILKGGYDKKNPRSEILIQKIEN